MIPVKLNIRNFLSYRENVPTLDFTGLHVACLCGDNGHGKSALLDAVTWCLWGQARGQVQDDLVSYGAGEARVELEFLARDGRFKVTRSRRRGGGRRRQGASDVQLASMTDDGEMVQVVSGNTIRETQARIEQLVGMDYETFINSAFLLQGRADEFTNKSPAERKAVLSSVLGLGDYDRFQARAREKVTAKRSQSDRLTGRLRQIQSEMEALGNPEEELAAAILQLAEVTSQLEGLRRDSDVLRERVSGFRTLHAALTETKTRQMELGSELGRVNTYIEAAEGRIREHEAVIARAGEIEAGVESLEAARQRFVRFEAARQTHDALRQEQNDLARAVEVEKTRLEEDARQLRRRINEELGPLAESAPALAALLEESGNALAGLTEKAGSLSGIREQLQTLSTGIGEAQSLAAQYQTEGEQIKERLRLLESADPHGIKCPLCLSPLSEEGRLRLVRNYDAEVEEKRDLYRANRSNLRHLESEKGQLEADLARKEQEYSVESSRLQGEMGRAEAQLKAAKGAQDELASAQSRLDDLVSNLDGMGYAPDAQARLRAVEEELATLGYDDSGYRQAVRYMQELEPFNEWKGRLETARSQLPGDVQAREQHGEQLQRLGAEIASLERQVAEAEAAVAKMPAAEARLEQLTREIAETEGELQGALARKALLEDRVERLGNLARDLEESRGELDQAQEDQGIYQDLASAFGRQGIQAMLIETVVPRLEEEANALLGRMTDNRMHVKLETQRDRRSGSGEPIETLEINVSDELGARNYEMYSGGEAFRVNLALRIALSRVLSQRTGAPLPTLFIDEGFGSQDASGRERILDVISAIEDDFDKIIIITHLDDLKDMFPTRIEVQKDENGSTFWLS